MRNTTGGLLGRALFKDASHWFTQCNLVGWVQHSQETPGIRTPHHLLHCFVFLYRTEDQGLLVQTSTLLKNIDLVAATACLHRDALRHFCLQR